MKFCKDCKHFDYNDGDYGVFAHCASLKHPPFIDVIWGHSRPRNCSDVRKHHCGETSFCGIEGKFWEKKDDDR